MQTQLTRETLSDSSTPEASIASFAPQQTLDRIIRCEPTPIPTPTPTPTPNQGAGLTSSADHWHGKWAGGEPSGEGTLTYAADGGGVYVGQYAGGRRHGHGRLSLPTGEEYLGLALALALAPNPEPSPPNPNLQPTPDLKPEPNPDQVRSMRVSGRPTGGTVRGGAAPRRVTSTWAAGWAASARGRAG